MTKVAIIGLGWWGKKITNVIHGKSKHIELVRAVDPYAPDAETFTRKLQVPLSKDYQQVLDDEQVQAVILATPHDLHTEQIKQAVAAGKHVFCEKPLALSRSEAEQSVRICREASLVLGIGHERRFEPPVANLLNSADEGRLGRIIQIEANFSHDKFLALSSDNWRLQSNQAPAGGMTATGIHLLDLSIRLLGEAESVHCVCENLVSNLPQGDTVAAYMRFKNGGTSYVSASLSTPFISRFAVYGSKGWIDIRDKAHVESPDGWVVTKSFQSGVIEVEEVPKAEPVGDNLDCFALAVEGNAKYPFTDEQMIGTIGLLEAIARSAKSGKTEFI